MIQSLAIRSDLMVDRARQTLEDHGSYAVLRTPEQPDYWFGNCVILKAYDPDLPAGIAIHRQHFPDTPHVCVQWDVPNLAITSEMRAMEAEGWQLSDTDTLVLAQPLIRHTPPPGFELRQLTPDDWPDLTTLQIAVGLETEDYDPKLYTNFVKARMKRHLSALHEGRCAWFGAFDGDVLAADMGIYVDEGIARWQSVETRPAYRRQGLCRAIVGRCYDWAMARDPQATPVIVADRNEAPGRTYRACGFTPLETMLALCKPAY